MLFSSLEFIFLFLPLCLLIYFLSPSRVKNAVLLIFSLIFYAYGEPIYLILMVFTISVDVAFALLIEKFSENKKAARAVLSVAVIFNLSLLFYFKYFGFCVSAICTTLGIPAPNISPALPIGISFYTFQSLSYVIDVYRGEARAQKGFTVPALYVTFFPQLIAGPIVKYGDIKEQLLHREHGTSRIAQGIRRFSAGLAKKVILANTAGELWEDFALRFDAASTDTLAVWLGLLFYAYQIYFDFSGYSDMALGLGKIFGFDLPENFNYPYISRSISEFWRRWHITLSAWFRDYLYISLGGNRRGRARMYLNLFIVWSLTGLWHGAGLNFLAWGMYFFLILALEKAFLLKILQKAPALLCRAYAFLLILIGWLIFASDGAAGSLTALEAVSAIKIMFGAGSSLVSRATLYELSRNAIPLIIMFLASLPLGKRISERLLAGRRASWAYPAISALSLSGIFLSVAYLVNSGYNPFLYFKF